jgi:hypothetical protein
VSCRRRRALKEVVSVADDGAVGVEGGESARGVVVAVGGPVSGVFFGEGGGGWRVELAFEPVEYGRCGVGRGDGEIRLEGGRVLHGRVGADQALVGVVAGEDAPGVLDAQALGEEEAREGGHEGAVDDGSEAGRAVGVVVHCCSVGGDEGGGWRSAEVGEGCGVCVLQECSEDLFVLVIAYHWIEAGRLREGLLEWYLPVLAGVDGDLMHDGRGAGAGAHDGHAVAVASKAVDVLLYPVNGESLVVEGAVGGAVGGLEGWSGKPAKCAELIVSGDVAGAGCCCGIKLRLCNEAGRVALGFFRSGVEAATVDPDDDRHSFPAIRRGIVVHIDR